MAKQKLKIQLDGSSSLDQAFDLPDFDFDIKPPKDDRKPATAIPKAVMRGTISGIKDTSFVNRVVRTALPPVFGEVDDLRKQVQQGVRTLYNSAAKEIKPAMNDLVRSIDKVVPEEQKRIKKGLSKIKEWTSETKYKFDYDEEQQREANIALEIGQVFKSTLLQKDKVDQERLAQDRAQRKIDTVLNTHHNDKQLSLLNAISRSTDITAQYTLNVNARFQESLLKVQYKSYYMLSDMLVQMKASNAETVAELKAITKNTGLPEFVKLRKSEAFQEQLRNRFISDLNTGLFGGREGFTKGFFERIGRKVRDKGAEVAGTFSAAAMGVENQLGADDPFAPKRSTGEKVAEFGGGAGIQMLAMMGGNKVNQMLKKNPKLAKIVKDAEYGMKNIPQGMKQFGNKVDYNDGFITKLGRAIVQAGLGPSGPMGKLQVDQVYSGDPNDPNTLRSASQFSRQNSKSLNEIIPGYLARIFREIQVLRTGNTSIGLTTYDYNKNKFLDSKNVAKSALKSIMGENNKEAHQEKVKELFSELDKDGNLSEEDRDSLVKFLTSENFKGNMMSQERLTNMRTFSRSGMSEKDAKKYAGVFDSYYSKASDSTLEGKERRNSLNNRLNSLGSEFNDSRAMIQELVNMGQYETVRQLGLINDKTNTIDFDRLISLYTDKKSPNIKGYSDSRANLLSPGVSASTGNYVSESKQGSQNTDYNGARTNFDMSPVTNEVQKTNTILERLEKLMASRLASIASNTHASAAVSAAQLDPSKTEAVKKALAKHMSATKSVFGEGVEKGKGVFDKLKGFSFAPYLSTVSGKISGAKDNFKDAYGRTKEGLADKYNQYRNRDGQEMSEEDYQRGDPSLFSSIKNIHRKTIGRAYGVLNPIARGAVGAIKPGVTVAKTMGRVGLNFTKSGVERLVDIRDVYVEGESSPRLIASVLRAGGYFDAKTMKPIRRLFQIKGDVVDKDGNVVLKADELKNTYMKTTRGGIFYLGKQIFSTLASVAKSGFAGMNAIVGAGVSAAVSIAKTGFKFTRNLFDMATDVYVKGEPDPVLYAVIMKNGGYFSQSTSKVITRPSMIDGPVVDRNGDVVLTKDHLKKGLVDKHGNSVGSPLLNAVRFGVGVAKLGIKAAMGVAKGIGKAIGSVTSFGGDALSEIFKKFSFGFGGEKSYDELVAIRKILEERLTSPRKKKKNRFDKDGDGIRDGSWQDKAKSAGSKVTDKAKDLMKLGGIVSPNRKNSLDAAAETISGAYDTAKDWIGKGIDAYGDWRGGGSGTGTNRDRAKERLKRMQRSRRGSRIDGIKNAGSKTIDAAKAAGQKIGETKGFKAGMQAGKSLATRAAQTGAGKAVTSAGSKVGSALGGIGEAALAAGGTAGSMIGKYGVKALGAAGAAYGAYSAYDNLKQGNYGMAAVDAGLTGLGVAGMVGGTAGVTGALSAAGGAAATAGGGLLGMAGTALAGIGSVFSFPVVAGVAAVGAVGYGGYKLYKYLTKPNMKPLSKMRMAQYGFGEEEIELVGKVQKFESDVQKYVKYDEEGKADITIDDKNATALMGHFGFEQKDAAMVNRFTVWFQQRFKPVFVTHMTALKKIGISKPLSDVDSAEPEQKKKYLNAVKFPEGPYNVFACPFPDMKLLGVGKRLVDYVTKKAETEIDKEVDKDGNKKKKTIEAVGIGAAAAGSIKDKLALTQSEIETRNAQTMDYSFSAKIGRAVSNTLKNIIDSNAVTKSAFATMSAVSGAVTKWLGYNVEPLEAVRFKTYGLTEMERSKVVGLRRLEEYIAPAITFNADGKAEWNGAVNDIMSEMRYDFETSDKNSAIAQDFAKWFSARFLPAYLNYRTFLKQFTGQDKQSSAEKLLKANDKYEVATKVAATDVWSILFSPWEKFKLSTDVSICKPNVVLLKDGVKESTMTDPGSKGVTKAAGSADTSSNSGLTPGSKATEKIANKDPNYIKTGSGISLNAPNSKIGTPPNPDEEPKPQRSGSSSVIASAKAGGAGTGGSKISTAGGEMMDGSGADQYLAYAKDATLNRANPEMIKLFKGMVQEYGQMTGKTVTVREGFRTYEQQAALRAKLGNGAAKPGNSMHEYGLAIDIDTVVANEMDKLGLMRKYGFTRPLGGEGWHIEPAGLQSVIQQAKKNPDLASQAIAGSPGKGGGGWGTQSGAGKASRNPEFAKSLLNTGDNAIGVASKEAAGMTPSEVNSGSKDTADNAVKNATLQGALNMKGSAPGEGMAKTVSTGGSPTGIGSSAAGAATNSPLYKDSKPGQAEGYSKMPAKAEGSGYMAVKDVISEASKLVGVDNKMMVQKAAIESGFNPNARAGTSSATGLYQFTKGTWNEMLSKYGSKYGIPPGTSPTDPRANAILAAQYMKDNAAMLKKTTGADPSSADLYMAHFLGPGGAKTMLSADQNQIAAKLLPDAAAANQSIFYKKDGSPRTVAEMRQVLSNKVDSSLSKHGIKLDSDTIDTKLQEATGNKTPYNPEEVNKQIKPVAPTSPNAATPSSIPTAAEMDAQLKAKQQQKASLTQALTPTPTSPMQTMAPSNVRITPNQIDQDLSKIMSSSIEIASSMKTTAEQSLGVLKEIRDRLTPELFSGLVSAMNDPKQDPNAVKKADPRKMEDASKPAVGYSRMT